MSNYFESHREEILRDYFALLRFPSVSSDVGHLRDCAACAAWIRTFLRTMGFSVDLMQPPKMLSAPPVVVAERAGTPGTPTVLFYGHYDVQPVDPVDQWKTPPFEPTLKDGRVYCRGAEDDKGQWYAFLVGLKALIAEGGRVPTMKVVLEGQEEAGSTAITVLAPTIRDRLAADVLCVCDTFEAASGRPAIVAGLRGVSHFTVRLDGPSYDLHSGTHGGLAPNPAQGIAELVASLHNPDGSIAVRGFCDHVVPPTDAERKAAEEDAQAPADYEKAVGCPPVGGESGLSMIERNSFRPTIEVNGIHGGYGGAGSKTVIPASAFAKLSMRLVPDQNPADVFDALVRHLKQHTPRGMKLAVEDLTGGAGGFRLPLASPLFRLAADILTKMDARGPVFQWDGASIPVVSVLHQVSGAAPLLVGFGREEDHIHSPNESYGLDQFERSFVWGRGILAALGS